MMNTNEAIKRRRLAEAEAEAAEAPNDDVVSRLEQRIVSMEAGFRREILGMKRADADLLAKNKAIESQLSSLQDETDRLKTKVSQLDEENRKLEAAFKTHVGNMDWDYAAPDPPSDSYWIEQGYDYGDEDITDEDYIENINDNFFFYVKEQSKRLRRGTFGLQDDSHVSERLYFGNSDEDAVLIRYDRALLPHWGEFSNAMVNWQFSPVRGTIERTQPFCVHLSNIELPPNILEMLCETFKPGGLGHVEEFHLTQNEFQGSDGIEFALGIIQSQKKLTSFGYQENHVENDQDCQRLVDAIVSHPSISTCYLDCLCRGERNGHDYLVHLLRNEGMTDVSFRNCGVNTGGQSALFDMIKLHPKLDELYLGDNKLNDKDAIHIADALRFNRTLDVLSLWGNEFTQSGEDALKKVVYDDSSMNALADSNHVCTIRGLGFTQVFVNYNVYRNDDDCPKRCRARKMFHLLRERNKDGKNALHLGTETGGDTEKIVPFALAAIQIYGEQWVKSREWNDDSNGFVTTKNKKEDDTAELSITFELLKCWHVPALY